MNRPESSMFPQDPGQLFKPLLISMACLLGTCIVIVAYHLVLVKYCIRRRHRSSIALEMIAGSSLAADSPDGTSPVGVEDKILRMIPVIQYSSAIGNPGFGIDQRECVVCLGEMEDGEAVRLLPSCRHAFHVPCIDEWFLAHSRCPLCRSPVVALVVDEEPGDDKPATTAEANERCSNTGMLRHCVSLVIPPVEVPECKKGLGLKRSFSMMDQSRVVVINIEQGEEEKATASSSSSSQEDGDLQERNDPISRFDQVSSRLIRSFSQLWIGKTGCGNVGR